MSKQSADEARYQDKRRYQADEVDGPRAGGATNEIQVAGMAFVPVRAKAHCSLPNVSGLVQWLSQAAVPENCVATESSRFGAAGRGVPR
ncbi:hypothetical protein BRAS3843_820002 [Bradyrhizobium sp. STM 3843]|nr:hypothetical protein BRAS3843_820002 [Bradyrhizobium sp. STM 3843]